MEALIRTGLLEQISTRRKQFLAIRYLEWVTGEGLREGKSR
jgi:hypothetical protein